MLSLLNSSLFFAFSLFAISSAGTKRGTKQVGLSSNGPVTSTQDHQSAETHGFGLDHGHGHDKYFQMQDTYFVKHGPEEYEFGHVEETPNGWEERVDRVSGIVKQGKVKWGDKYGGYGEHYWDYNHQDKSDHGDDHGHGHGHGGYDGHYRTR